MSLRLEYRAFGGLSICLIVLYMYISYIQHSSTYSSLSLNFSPTLTKRNYYRSVLSCSRTPVAPILMQISTYGGAQYLLWRLSSCC